MSPRRPARATNGWRKGIRRGAFAPRRMALRAATGARKWRPSVVVFFQQRSEEHTSELQSLMRISYAVFCLKKKKISRRRNQQYEATDLKEIKSVHHKSTYLRWQEHQSMQSKIYRHKNTD